jgi:hypothetical protein
LTPTDSRAVAAIIPELITEKTTNLAVLGGTSIEAYFAATKLIRCKSRPKLVVVAINAERFTNPNTFRDDAVRYRWVGPDDVSNVEATEWATGDYSISRAIGYDRLPPFLRPYAYALRLPICYAIALSRAGSSCECSAILQTYGKFWPTEGTF